MTEKDFPSFEQPEDYQEDIVSEIRAKTGVGEETAPVFQKLSWTPREISTRRSKWIVRGLIGFFTAVIIIVGMYWIQGEEIREAAKFDGGPAVEIYPLPPKPIGPPIPEDKEPLLPDELIAADAGSDPIFISGDTISEPPFSTPIPLPDDTPEIPVPTPES